MSLLPTPTREKKANKWLRGAIPALLLHCSIGTVYCWSIFSQDIATHIGVTKSQTEWAFSIAIFFLGMSAAFLGNIVEKNIHKSSLISTIFFTAGMLLTGLFIFLGGKNVSIIDGKRVANSYWPLIGIYLSYGVIMGIGLGTGYLSPVKTLMLWFKDHKGLATGLAVAGFGAAKAIASPIMKMILEKLGESGIYMMFWILGCVYFVMMFLGHLLLHKPADWVEPQASGEKPKIMEKLKTRPLSNFVGIWLMFYINITCGLALISQEKMIYQCIGLGAMIGILSTFSAIFNAAGRIGFSTWGDYMKDRNSIYKVIFALSIFFTGLVIVTGGIKNGRGVLILIILVITLNMFINAGYGGGFSNVPTLLSDHYGMSNISAIHGITLSAWAFAGLTGNQVATLIVKHTGQYTDLLDDNGSPVLDAYGKAVQINPVGYQNVLIFVLVLFVIALILCCTLVRPSGKALEEKEKKNKQ